MENCVNAYISTYCLTLLWVCLDHWSKILYSFRLRRPRRRGPRLEDAVLSVWFAWIQCEEENWGSNHRPCHEGLKDRLERREPSRQCYCDEKRHKAQHKEIVEWFTRELQVGYRQNEWCLWSCIILTYKRSSLWRQCGALQKTRYAILRTPEYIVLVLEYMCIMR